MAGNHVLLETIELTSSASSVTFDNIPQSGYTDLKLIISTRHSGAQDANAFYIKFNGSTTSQSAKFIEGSGTSAVSGSNANPYGGVENGSASLANTYNNCEIYIPNYTSSNQKSYSSDSVSENNTTAAYQWLTAGLWANTSAITSIAIMPDNGTKSYVAGSTFSLYGIADVNTTPVTAPKATGGNMVSTDGTYWYHTFLTSGNFVPQTSLTCDYLVVAGGGGTITSASQYYSGGGGGGGLRSSVSPTGGGASAESPLSLTFGTSYPVTVGAGGAATPSGRYGVQGSNSTISTITSIGGGYGSVGPAATSGAGGNGGSGGGAGSNNGSPFSVYSGGTGTTGQGYNGGQNDANDAYAGGAGGGAGGAGGNANNGKGGTGGAAVSNSISGTATYYAGGGWGGKGYYGSATIGDSGTGYNQNPNTGMGGVATNAAGQSGIVIIRYAV